MGWRLITLNNYKKYSSLKKIYNNKVFSYKNTCRINKNYSRKDFSKTWNYHVLFKNSIFEQTNFNNSLIENCIFENCLFINCYITESKILNTMFKNCQFENFAYLECNHQSTNYINSKFINTYYLPFTKIPPNGFEVTGGIQNVKFSSELQATLKTSLQNPFIKNSNTLFLKKSQHLSRIEKNNMKLMNKKESKILGLSKNERLIENRKRKAMKKTWLNKTNSDALKGENRVLSKNILLLLLNRYNEQQLIKGLKFITLHITQDFKNISYLINIIEKYLKNNINESINLK